MLSRWQSKPGAAAYEEIEGPLPEQPVAWLSARARVEEHAYFTAFRTKSGGYAVFPARGKDLVPVQRVPSDAELSTSSDDPNMPGRNDLANACVSGVISFADYQERRARLYGLKRYSFERACEIWADVFGDGSEYVAAFERGGLEAQVAVGERHKARVLAETGWLPEQLSDEALRRTEESMERES